MRWFLVARVVRPVLYAPLGLLRAFPGDPYGGGGLPLFASYGPLTGLCAAFKACELRSIK